MSSIYRNCHFTVAATHARDGEGELFHSTPDFKVSGEAPDGQSYKLYFREAMDHHIEVVHGGSDVDWGQNSFPLLSRAWVYQERMLSTRVIHFGRLEMFFECRSGIWCECSRIADDFQSGSTSRAVVKNEFAAILDSSNQSDMSGQYSCATLWRTVVSSYSVLRLTRTSDRLPAIGGLARVMGAQRKARYLAGLWEDSLNDDLIYTIFNPLPKPYSRDAPTWSWASVNSDTAYLSELEAPALDSPNTLWPRLPYTHFSKVEQCEVLPAAVDEFEQLSHGFLTISGLVAEGHFGVRMEANIFNGKKEANYYAVFAHLRQAIYPDYLPEDMKSGTPVLCLRMSTIQYGTEEFLVSLVLKESTTFPGCFERIGSMRIQSHPPPVDPLGGIYEEASLGTVTIF
ncbi:hypothetical protein BJY04DRAFT_223388 [Aspergillus karnatakaensis]|uniref:putative HET domain protein n=1 Tax=Aspergillus karnatakaensis TaxID=1810916 RepID=UPI003CCD3FF2